MREVFLGELKGWIEDGFGLVLYIHTKLHSLVLGECSYCFLISSLFSFLLFFHKLSLDEKASKLASERKSAWWMAFLGRLFLITFLFRVESNGLERY